MEAVRSHGLLGHPCAGGGRFSRSTPTPALNTIAAGTTQPRSSLICFQSRSPTTGRDHALGLCSDSSRARKRRSSKTCVVRVCTKRFDSVRSSAGRDACERPPRPMTTGVVPTTMVTSKSNVAAVRGETLVTRGLVWVDSGIRTTKCIDH